MPNKSHKGEEPVGWVTVKGKHFPKWKDGSIGWQDGQEDLPSKTTTKDAKKVSEFGKDTEDKITAYTDKFLKKRSDKQLEELKSNLDKQTKIAGTTEQDQIALAAIEREQKSRAIKKTASMDLGNGLRLTADVSNPNKNISEVERAKKVNREKQYANKKMYQHQKAVQEEQEKAQAIADAISQKTGIANRGSKTTSRNARYDTSKSNRSMNFSSMSIAELKKLDNDAWQYGLSKKQLQSLRWELEGRGYEWVDGKWKKKKQNNHGDIWSFGGHPG